MSAEYEYDVAFSFLQRDEELAVDIADRLRSRVKLFIYSEQQKNLIANDGVDTFSQIFKEGARVVVILFRQAWGTTKWTGIEERAIKSRHLDEGPKFLVVASLDGKHPVWYPDTWIWGDLERYGIDGLASVVETKVRQRGGEVRSESLTDYAAAAERQITFASDRRSWRNSERAIQDAIKELDTLFALLNQTCEQISRSGHLQTQLQFHKKYSYTAVVSGWNVHVFVSWGHTYGNTLDMSGLRIVMSEGGRFLGDMAVVQPQEIAATDYDLDWDGSRRIGWREEAGGKSFYTSVQLSDFWMRRLLDRLRDRAVGNSD
jgi:hypothetical protein